MEKENEELKQIIENLCRKIERSKTAGSTRQQDLQAQYDMLANENDALYPQLLSLRAALEKTHLKNKDTRGAVRCLEMTLVSQTKTSAASNGLEKGTAMYGNAIRRAQECFR